MKQPRGRDTTPWRLRLARGLCGRLPPILAQSLRQRIYPRGIAFADDHAFRTVNRAGYSFEGRTSDPAAYPFAVHGYYDWRNVAIALALCREGQAILEVGAHIGTETVSFAAAVGPHGRVLAFEPVVVHVGALRRIFEHAANVTIVPSAVSDAVGELHFVLPRGSATSGTGHLAGTSEQIDAPSVAVTCVTLDSVRDRVRDVAIVFIDAEGAESAILRGAVELIARDRPHLVVEASAHHTERSGSTLASLQAQLAGLGYTTFEVARLGLRPVDAAGGRSTRNWLCVHSARMAEAGRATAMLARCGLMPFVPLLNPLTRVAGL